VKPDQLKVSSSHLSREKSTSLSTLQSYVRVQPDSKGVCNAGGSILVKVLLMFSCDLSQRFLDSRFAGQDVSVGHCPDTKGISQAISGIERRLLRELIHGRGIICSIVRKTKEKRDKFEEEKV
jgi:hypothetical protein